MSLDFYAWEWEDEKKKWNPYLAQTAVDIENAQLSCSGTHPVAAFGRNYTIDLNELEQSNDDTGVIRQVRRTRSGISLFTDCI